MDRRKVLGWVRDPASKGTTDKPQPDFWFEAAEVQHDIIRWLASSRRDFAAGWLLDQARRLRHTRPTPKVRPGQIAEVEFGVGYRGEFAFTHPCVVLKKQGDHLTVIPLTSQSDGRGVVVDGGIVRPPQDPVKTNQWRIEFTLPGAAKTSAALIEQVRSISQLRLVKRWEQGGGNPLKVPETALEVIHERLVAYVGSHFRDKYAALERQYRRAKRDIRKLKQTASSLKGTLDDRELQLDQAIDYLVAKFGEATVLRDLPFIQVRRGGQPQ